MRRVNCDHPISVARRLPSAISPKSLRGSQFGERADNQASSENRPTIGPVSLKRVYHGVPPRFPTGAVVSVKILAPVAILFVALVVGTVGAGEPARAFLDGLRARGFHDVAIDYLDKMSTSPLAPVGLKETVLYEKALTLIASSRLQRDPEVSIRFLDEAQSLLQQFVAAHESHSKSNSARSQLGSLIFERARMKVAQSKKENSPALLDEARKLYEEAFEVFGQLQAKVSEELDLIPKVLDTRDRKQAQLAQRRKQLRADNLQTELLAAAIREETADTLADGSAKNIQYLTEAASLYDSIYKNYRGRLAGFYARMYQGRCNQRMGRLRDALGYYGELLDQPNESEGMFDLKTETLRRAMECWLAPSQRKYVETIKRGNQWLALAPANKDRESNWLSIRLSLARALKMQADAAKKEEPPDTRTFRESIAQALQHAKFVASESGELQEPARQLVTSLGGVSEAEVETEPTTFAEAQVAGKEALDAIEPARRAIETAKAQLAAEKDPAAKEELQKQAGEAEAEFERNRQDAIGYYRLALQLADRDTPRSDVNLVRYFLCYLYYLKQDYFNAALVGDFVSMRYPDAAGARQCAQISLSCYLMIFDRADPEDRQFEVARLVAVANHIADTWPGTADAENSLHTLVPYLVNAGEFDHAVHLTQRIPESSPKRGQSEWITGQAIWGAAVALSQQIHRWELEGPPDQVDLAAKRAELEKMQQTAREMLAAGYKRLPEQPEITTSNSTAMLSLAQAHHASLDDALAIEVLEHEQLGPLVLVDQSHAAVQNPVFIETTYRTALEAYVAQLGTGGEAMMQKAERAMGALQTAVASDPSGRQRMIAVYVNLARSVEAQMKSASPDARQEMAQVFEAFLKQLAAKATDPGTLNWVAETFAGIGAGFDDGSGMLSADAKKYYENAIVAFRNILTSGSVPPKTATQIRVRMATVMAKIRDYANALALLEQVLAQNPNAINVQVEAARLLQQWAKEDAKMYSDAIAGIRLPQSNVWGWGKIATGTLPHKEFRETFFEARYELARCQLELAMTKQGEEKKKLIDNAWRDASRTKQLYPTLGGADWTAKYNQLLNRILVAQGKKPTEVTNIAVPAE